MLQLGSVEKLWTTLAPILGLYRNPPIRHSERVHESGQAQIPASHCERGIISRSDSYGTIRFPTSEFETFRRLVTLRNYWNSLAYLGIDVVRIRGGRRATALFKRWRFTDVV